MAKAGKNSLSYSIAKKFACLRGAQTGPQISSLSGAESNSSMDHEILVVAILAISFRRSVQVAPVDSKNKEIVLLPDQQGSDSGA